MNQLVVAATSLKFTYYVFPACVMSSEFLTITPLTVFGLIEKLILLKIKFKKTVLAELS